MIEINKELLTALHEKAKKNERLRVNYDLRTTTEDNSQRMLNVLEPCTKVAIHRHSDTSETILNIQGRLDVIFYDTHPDDESSAPVSTVVKNGTGICLFERNRVFLSPSDGKYGVQIPAGVWHSIEVYEPSTIFEAKDGAYKPIN